jgi:SAM-dependent methyltransferase
VQRHFEETLREFGDTARGADWRDEASREERFRQLDRLALGTRVGSICELGCGSGAYLGHLRHRGYAGTYVGVDITPGMIDAARARFPSDRFVLGSEPEPADVVVASGIFNVRAGNDAARWVEHVDRTVDAMWSAARRGLVFNVLTLDSDAGDRAADFHYVDVDEFLAGLERLDHATIEARRDFGAHELTLLVRATT